MKNKILAVATACIVYLFCGAAGAQTTMNPGEAAAMRTTLALLSTEIHDIAKRTPAAAQCADKMDNCTEQSCMTATVTVCQAAARRVPALRPIIKKVEEARGCFSLHGAESTACWETLKEDISGDKDAITAFSEAANGPEGAEQIPDAVLKRGVKLRITRENVHTGTKTLSLEVLPQKAPRTYAPSAAVLLSQAAAVNDHSTAKTIALWAGLPAAGALIGFGIGELAGPEETGTENGNAVFYESEGLQGAAIGFGVGLGLAATIHFLSGNDAPAATTASNGRGSGLATLATW